MVDLMKQYLEWYKQFEEALASWDLYRVEGEYRLLVVAGMGGSGIVGDYLMRLSDVYGGLPVVVYKSHVAPQYIRSDDLVVLISYSGNTRETLEFLRMVSVKTKNIVLVSSNGFLEEVSRKSNYLFIRVLKGLVPRVSLPSMLVSVLGLLDSSGYSIVSKSEVEKTMVFLREVVDEVRDKAFELANFIIENKGLLVIATHYPYDVLGVRGKNEFNENTKVPVKVEVAPEWMHNDIVGWEKPFSNKYSVIAVYDRGDSIGSKLVDYMVEIYSGLGFPVYRVELVGEGYFAKLMYGSLLFGLASVIAADKRGVNPLVTESIKRYKDSVVDIFGELRF